MSQTAYKFQIVSKGVYEAALSLYLTDDVEVNLQKLKEFFDNADNKDISFEVFFKNKDFKSFIGFVIEPLARQEQHTKLQQLIKATHKEMVLKDAVLPIAEILNTRVTLCNPDFKEVGFDVFWGSRGHVTVQDEKQTIAYEDLMATYPNFNAKYDDRPIMMEFAWSVDEEAGVIYRYWTAQQLSKDNGTIDKTRYEHLLI